MNIKPSLVALTLLAVFAFSACKKKHDPSKSDMLVGKWKLTTVTEDANSNGIVDAGETTIPVGDSLGLTMTYANNGTGTIGVSLLGLTFDAVSFKWSLVQNDKFIKMDYTDDSTGMTSSVQEEIASLDGKTLLIKADDSTVSIPGLQTYVKQ